MLEDGEGLGRLFEEEVAAAAAAAALADISARGNSGEPRPVKPNDPRPGGRYGGYGWGAPGKPCINDGSVPKK